MKRVITQLVFLLSFAPALHAQAKGMAGTWQGTLNAPARPLREVIKINQESKGAWRAVLYSIDVNGQPYPATTTTVAGAELHCIFAMAGGIYDGTLSADGNSITGAWEQSGVKVPMVLVRPTSESAWAIPEPPAPTKMMPLDFHPVFEISAIRPTDPDAPYGEQRRGRDFAMTATLDYLIISSLGLEDRQVIGLPGWAKQDRYDISARMNGDGAPDDAQVKEAMWTLVQERFGVVAHHETRQMPAYEIVTAKDGPKLTKSTATDDIHNDSMAPGSMVAFNFAIVNLCHVLGRYVVDRPVVDHTGLTNRYDISLRWTPDEFELHGATPLPPPEHGDAPPGFFKAIEQQLGLRVQPVKTDVDVLVIDHVERPTEN